MYIFICLDGIVKNNQIFDFVELIVDDNHLIEQKRGYSKNSVSVLII